MESNTNTRGEEWEVPSWASPCIGLLREYFDIADTANLNENAVEILPLRPVEPISWDRALRLSYPRLIELGCYPRLVKRDRALTLALVRKRDKGSHKIIGLLLAIATLALVYVSGLALAAQQLGKGFAWSPIGYLVALLVPLTIHEMGHWITLRHYRTPASMPYLIPAPPLQLGFLGTFGAVINMRWLPPDDVALALTGIAGPIAGFLAAIPFAYYGIKMSVVLPLGTGGSTLPIVPLIFYFIPTPVKVGPHQALYMSPMAFASYVVFIVTFLNLMPVASLDGGHVVRSLLGFKAHYMISIATIAALLAAAYRWPVFTLFALLALGIFYLNRSGHPGTALGIRERRPLLALIALLYAVLLVLTFPVPVG